MTSSPSHTPGPWRIGNAGRTIFGPPTSLPSPVTIAEIAESNRLSPDRQQANARLIASAPELLDFAEKVALSACLEQINQGRCICFACEAGRLLAKVQGGQS